MRKADPTKRFTELFGGVNQLSFTAACGVAGETLKATRAGVKGHATVLQTTISDFVDYFFVVCSLMTKISGQNSNSKEMVENSYRQTFSDGTDTAGRSAT